jgi:hypothetical protein
VGIELLHSLDGTPELDRNPANNLAGVQRARNHEHNLRAK